LEDPFPSDEMDLLTFERGSKNKEGRETSVGFEFSKRLTPDLALGVEWEYLFAEESGEPRTSSHTNHPTKKLAPAEGASLRILSPQDGQVFKGDQIPVSFRLVKESARSTSMLMSTARSWACSRQTKEPLRESRRVSIGWS
jgi:hypothetical protein